MAGLGNGGELTLGERTFRVRLDPVNAGPGSAARRDVVTLNDVTAAKRALVAERTISRTLQQSLLPEHLPQHAHVALHAWHVAAEQELIVGGDWYDVIETERGLWLVMSDIAGHGVAAAAQAGQLRHSLRVYASEGFDLAEAVQRLNELVVNTELTEMATICIVAIDHDADAARIVRAGHPPPLLIPVGGPPRLADGGAGVVLGVGGVRCLEYTVPFETGDRIVLFTDGLVERPGETIDASLARMAESAVGVEGLQELQQHLVRELVDMRALRDDVAVLLAQRR